MSDKDAIYRQDAIDVADKIIARDTSGNNDVVKAMTAWKEFIKGLPSAEPRKKGKWIKDGEIPNTCSVCGEDWDKYVEGQEIWYTGEIPNYCPNCGADNREDT